MKAMTNATKQGLARINRLNDKIDTKLKRLRLLTNAYQSTKTTIEKCYKEKAFIVLLNGIAKKRK